jgi:hypothetical protein
MGVVTEKAISKSGRWQIASTVYMLPRILPMYVKAADVEAQHGSKTPF